MRNRGTPGRTMLEHGVQDNQQLTHTGCESQLLELTRRQQALIEDPDDWVVAAGRQRPHVQSAANSGASTPDGAFAPRSTAVSVEGSHTNQGSDLTTVQRAQLRQVCQESQRELFSHAGNSAQEILSLSPHRTLVQSLPQFLIQVRPTPAPARLRELGCADGGIWRQCPGGFSQTPAWSRPGVCGRPEN